MRRSIMRLSMGLAVFAALLGGGAANAAAHIQVAPAVAAPNDAVRFDVLVPGERSDASTTKVALKVPPGVLPYSFGETPGWSRQLVLAKDKSVAQIVWSGRVEPDAFVEFSFLAATPPRPGVIAWKALQHYSDGSVVRWIGAPDSAEPAAQTEISAGAALQNAGGEGPGGSGEEAEARTESSEGSSGSDDRLARVLGIAALALAAAAGALAWRRGRST